MKRASCRVSMVLVAGLLGVAGAAYAQMKGMKMEMLEGREMGMSRFDFNETVSRIKAAIEGQQMMVLFTPDHQQMLSMVGLQTKPMVTIEFFHPRYGKTIFMNDGRASLEVPLRIAVMENEEGKVMFQYNKPSWVFKRYKNLSHLGRELDQVMENIVADVKMKM